MKKKIIYAIIIVIVLLVLGLVSLKLFSKDKSNDVKDSEPSQETEQPTSSRVVDAVAFYNRINHVFKMC